MRKENPKFQWSTPILLYVTQKVAETDFTNCTFVEYSYGLSN